MSEEDPLNEMILIYCTEKVYILLIKLVIIHSQNIILDCPLQTGQRFSKCVGFYLKQNDK